jgi:SAM-dependent methyltransferase
MAKTWEQIRLGARRRSDAILCDGLARLGSPPPTSLCDVGCHDGTKTLLWARAAGIDPAACVGIDVKEREPAGGVRILRADVEREPLPLPADAVDVVVASQVLEHLKNVHHLLLEIRRILAPGGRLVVGVPNLASAHNRVLLLLGRQPTTIRAASGHVRGFTWREMLALLRMFGFRVEWSRGAGFYPFPDRVLDRLLPRAAVYQCHIGRKERELPAAALRAFSSGDTSFVVSGASLS